MAAPLLLCANDIYRRFGNQINNFQRVLHGIQSAPDELFHL